MSSKYFKYRKAFQRNAHPYDLGVLTGLKRGSDDNHFLLKVYKLEPSSFGDYYLYHLDYYLSKDEQNSEEEFFKHVWRIVFKRIEYFESRDPFSSKHALYVANIEKLRAFQEFLAPRDKWNIRPNDALLREKDGQIADLLAKIEEQQRELKEYRNFDVVVKAMVQDGYLATFMDLIHQMRALKLPNGRKLLMDDQPPQPDTVLEEGDILAIYGYNDHIKAFL